MAEEDKTQQTKEEKGKTEKKGHVKKGEESKGKENPMRKIKIEKVVLSMGGTAENLEKGMKLLNLLTGKKPAKMMSKKRIPAFKVRPGLEVGALITIRKNPEEILRKMLSPADNTLSEKQVSQNGFSFGVKEYIEIPGIEYQRDIGIMGFDVTVVFSRAGRRVKMKKIKKGKFPKRQMVSREEIIEFMKNKFKTKFVRGRI